MLSYRLKVSSPYSPENVLIPTKSENLKEPPPLPTLGRCCNPASLAHLDCPTGRTLRGDPDATGILSVNCVAARYATNTNHLARLCGCGNPRCGDLDPGSRANPHSGSRLASPRPGQARVASVSKRKFPGDRRPQSATRRVRESGQTYWTRSADGKKRRKRTAKTFRLSEVLGGFWMGTG